MLEDLALDDGAGREVLGRHDGGLLLLAPSPRGRRFYRTPLIMIITCVYIYIYIYVYTDKHNDNITNNNSSNDDNNNNNNNNDNAPSPRGRRFMESPVHGIALRISESESQSLEFLDQLVLGLN